MYENMELGLDLKLLFMVTGACYESGLYEGINWAGASRAKIQQIYENL